MYIDMTLTKVAPFLANLLKAASAPGTSRVRVRVRVRVQVRVLNFTYTLCNNIHTV